MPALDQVGKWPARTATVAVVGPGGVLDGRGPQGRVLPWASVTKLLTALAVLVQVDRGVVDLAEPAGPEGSTVRHLLAHASGLASAAGGKGTSVGRRRIYSNLGFEVLAQHLAARVGRPFPALLRAEVLLPLELYDTTLDGSPAAGARGPLRDLAGLARELLDPTLISGELLAEATTPAFPELDGVLPGLGRFDPNPWGLGFEIRGEKDPHWTGRGNSPATFGHFGRTGSFLWVDPEAGLALAALTDREFGDWALKAWPTLADAVLEEYR